MSHRIEENKYFYLEKNKKKLLETRFHQCHIKNIIYFFTDAKVLRRFIE